MPRYSTHFGLTSLFETVKRAEKMIDLAEKSADLQDPLLGASIILLAIALDQIVSFSLYQIDHDADPFGEKSAPTRAKKLMGESLWSRIQNTPPLSTVRPFKFNPESDYVSYLQELIIRRNQLVHIREEGRRLEFEIPEGQKETAETVTAALLEVLSEDVDLDSMRIENPWIEVTIAEARRAFSATNIYIEALFAGDESAIELLTSRQD